MKILLFLCIGASLVHLGVQQYSYLILKIPRNLPPKNSFDYMTVGVEFNYKTLKDTYEDLFKSGSTIQAPDEVTVFLKNDEIPLNKNAKVIATDFGNPTNVKTTLNNYVTEHTSEQISSFFNDFKTDTKAVVLNCVDDWKLPNSGGSHYSVQLSGQYNAMVNNYLGFTMIEFPKNKGTTALLILPDVGKEESVGAAVNSSNLATWKKSLTLQSINLEVPKVTLYACSSLTFEIEKSNGFEYQSTKFTAKIAATIP